MVNTLLGANSTLPRVVPHHTHLAYTHLELCGLNSHFITLKMNQADSNQCTGLSFSYMAELTHNSVSEFQFQIFKWKKAALNHYCMPISLITTLIINVCLRGKSLNAQNVQKSITNHTSQMSSKMTVKQIMRIQA